MSEENHKVSGASIVIALIAWAWVGIPLIWGLAQTVAKAAVLFN